MISRYIEHLFLTNSSRMWFSVTIEVIRPTESWNPWNLNIHDIRSFHSAFFLAVKFPKMLKKPLPDWIYFAFLATQMQGSFMDLTIPQKCAWNKIKLWKCTYISCVIEYCVWYNVDEGKAISPSRNTKPRFFYLFNF